MAENSRQPVTVILPVVLGGLIVAGVALYPSGEELPATVPPPVGRQEEVRLVDRAIEQGGATLPADAPGLGLAERHLLLRLNSSEERRLEVAGGLYAIAAKHLAQARTPEAMRVAQACADLVPDSLLAARCWLLCGQASAATHPDLPLSLRYFERADAALQRRLIAHPDEVEALRDRASAVQWLGQSEDHFGRTEEAIAHLRELTGTAALAQIQPPVDRLRAMLTLGRLLRKTGQGEEANQWLASAQTLGTSTEIPAPDALRALIDSVHQLSPDATDPARYEALRALWDTQRFESLPEWYVVGDELASEYYFHEPRQLADFELVSRPLLTRLPHTLETLSAEPDQRGELESLYATNLLLAADSARERGDAGELARLVTLFESQFAGRDVKFTAPLDRPAQRMHRIGEIYRTTMTGHVDQLRQKQATGAEPPRR